MYTPSADPARASDRPDGGSPSPNADPREEFLAVAWSAAYFFFLLASYYILRALRDEMGVSGGVENLPWLFMGTLTAVLVCNPVLAAIVSRYPRRRFIPLVYRFFELNLVLVFLAFRWADPHQRLIVARVFFIWLSVFNLFAVSVFWGLMADLFDSRQGRRLFGYIGLGGTLGAAAGAFFTSQFVGTIGVTNLFLIPVALIEVAVLCVNRLGRLCGDHGSVARRESRDAPPQDPAGRADPALAVGGVGRGLLRAFSSPYLLAITACMVAYTFGSTFLYLEQGRIVRDNIHTSELRTAFFARIDLYINLASLVVQALLTRRIIAWIGIGPSMAVVPAVTLAGIIALVVSPSTAVIFWAQVVKNAAHYSIARPAREVLFTVLPRADKYKAKSMIDTFVYRAGDAAGAWLHTFIARLGATAAPVALATIPIAALWAMLSLSLGRQQARLAAEHA